MDILAYSLEESLNLTSMFKTYCAGVPVVVQWKRIRLGTMRLRVRSLPRLVGSGSGVAVNCGVGCRRSLDLVLLWLWCRLTAIAPIGLLTWETPYARGTALKRQKQK